MKGEPMAVRRLGKVLYLAGAALLCFQFGTDARFGEPQSKAGSEVAPWPIDFQKDIQPIFEKNCYSCHGPSNPLSGFRLDVKQQALKGGNNGRAIVPGEALESPLYARVAGRGGVSRMPMGGQPLDPALVEKIRRWIDEGANWPDAVAAKPVELEKHWAFVGPRRPPVPKVKQPAWSRNPIDHFVHSRLEAEKLAPSPPADRVTLLRRLSLDLIGLPPTPEEVDAFLADKSSHAYEKEVDRLLRSPHYGERWGRVWLDAARYADSDGYEKDKQRRVWFYRDWVINALNRDLPYNQFIIDQIAGDMLPHPSQDQIVATGFLRNSMINEEGGVDPEQFRMEAMFDRMDAIGKAILGLTINCAQCHSHKFDPLLQEEYYRMFAFLNDSHEANVAVYTPAEQMRRTEILRRTREIEAGLQRRNPGWQERMVQWEQQVSAGRPDRTVLRPAVDDISTGGQKYFLQEDGSFLTQGYAPSKHKVKLTVRTELMNITAFRLELMNDPNLPLGGPGRSLKGTCALTEFEAEAAPASAPDKVTKIKFAKATADINQPEMSLEPIFEDKSGKRRVSGPVDYAIDGKEETAWGIDAGPGLRNQPRKAVFLAANCRDTDQACAALIQDLKERGMLQDTLVIWGGEFGRTPMVQGENNGRDHHPNAFTMWLAGGGVKPGLTLGESDDLGFNVTKDQVHIHDLHATMLQLLGFDHTKLTYKFQGRNFRLTDVHGNVVKPLLA